MQLSYLLILVFVIVWEAFVVLFNLRKNLVFYVKKNQNLTSAQKIDSITRLAACWMLKEISTNAITDEVKKEILQARDRAYKVKKSPLFDLNK